MTAYGPGNPPPEFDPPRADLWPGVISLDQVVGYQVGGKMHAPGEVTIALSLPAEPRIHSQEEFLTALDVLLDHTLHADECYIDDAQTECVCVIGKVRAVLPPCGATYRPKHPQRGDRIATCLRNAHPASPDRHVF